MQERKNQGTRVAVPSLVTNGSLLLLIVWTEEQGIVLVSLEIVELKYTLILIFCHVKVLAGFQ